MENQESETIKVWFNKCNKSDRKKIMIVVGEKSSTGLYEAHGQSIKKKINNYYNQFIKIV